MAMLFGMGGSKSPQPQPLPAAPAVDPAQIAAQQKKAAETAMQASAGGRASTQLTGPNGDTLGQSSVSKTLMAG